MGKVSKWRRGFWREFFSRDNSVVNTMAVISLVISAPVAAISFASLIYDVFWLGYGLTDQSVKLLLGLITASTGGLAAGQFSKRTITEMSGVMPPGEQYTPPGPPPPRAKSAPPEGA